MAAEKERRGTADRKKRAVAGVDVGSMTSKAVVMLDNKIVGFSSIRTGVDPAKNGITALRKALQAAAMRKTDLGRVVATGYGRVSAQFADEAVTEITCHAKGAYFLYPGVRTIIDMGGQDCKVIRLSNAGKVLDFAMNEKCAAGTGRFLEVMANILKVKLDALGPLSMTATTSVAMSSTCTVFAESETISLLAKGEKPANIINGIHQSVCARIKGLFGHMGIESEVFFSGGVAKNLGLQAALEEALKVKMVKPIFDPQLTGALGAALIAGQ